MQIIETYLKCIQDANLGDHASVLGLLITFVGFVITFVKLWRVGIKNTELEAVVRQTLVSVSQLDTLKDLSALIERLKNINIQIMTSEAMNLAQSFSSFRAALIKIREENDLSNGEAHSTIQGIITKLAETENRIVTVALSENDLTAKKRQNILKTTNTCLDELHALITRIQNRIFKAK